jgi:hypothetical protein
MRFSGFSSFSVLRGTPMLDASRLFKKLKCYEIASLKGEI